MQKIEPAQLKELLESKSEFLLIDIRQPDVFADGFIPGSINITSEDYGKIFPTLISKKVDTVIISDDIEKINPAQKSKADYTVKYSQWSKEEGIKDMIIIIDTYEFGLDLKFDKSIHIIDLRSKEDYEVSHISDVQNIPLKDIPFVYEDFELTDQLYFYSYNLEEAMTAASLFKKQGFDFVKPVEGGFEAILTEENIKVVKKKKKS